MGKRKYPPLKHREITAILTALGFRLMRQEGTSHAQWERPSTDTAPRALVTLDYYDDFEEKMIKNLISQAGCSREQFYGAVKSTAKKI